MSESSVDSSIGEQDERDRNDRDKSRAKITRCFKALFCCFKPSYVRTDKVLEYDHDRYDYIVEKLVVKRVPLASFAIAADLRARRQPSSTPTSMSSRSRSSSTNSGNRSMINVVTQTASMRNTIEDKTTYDSAASKALRFDRDENKVPIVKSSNRQAESSVRREEMANRSESFAENMSEIATSKSGMKSDVSSRNTSATVRNEASIPEEPVRQGFGNSLFGFASKKNENPRTGRNDKPRRSQDAPSSFGKIQDDLIPRRNRRYVVSSFRVKRRKGSFDLAKPRDTLCGSSVDGKSLQHTEKSIEDGSTGFAVVGSKDRDSRSKGTVRWRITIRRRCTNAAKASEAVASEAYVAWNGKESSSVHLCIYMHMVVVTMATALLSITMAAIVIFSSSVTYKYKSKVYSCASVVAFLFIALSLFTPFFVISNAGGVWMKNRMHAETPDVQFSYKYLLLAEVDPYEEPVVCTTFETYKENKIKDRCTLIKVLETDLNGNGQKDALRFEAHFYTDKPIKSLRLLLFFNFELKHLIQTAVESIAVFDRILNHEAQEIQFFGDLELRQKGLLRSTGLYETYNQSIELSDYITLPELLLHNFYRKFSARITNERVTWRSGFSRNEAVVVIGELFYAENFIYYQPSMWEELKWAWIQYFSCLLVFAYVTRQILVYLFANRYLNTYIVRPWTDKQIVKK